jgi:DNA repair photolyase
MFACDITITNFGKSNQQHPTQCDWKSNLLAGCQHTCHLIQGHIYGAF